jgi:hypothetical protein
MRQRRSFRARCVGALASRMPSVSSRSFRARHTNLGWANLAEGRLHLDRLSATAAFRFFPLLRRPRRAREPSDGIPRGRQKSVRPAVLRCAAALRLCLGCGSIAPGRSIAIVVAIGAARRETGD